MSGTPKFEPDKYISDEPITESEEIELNRMLDSVKVRLFQKKWNGFLGPLVASISFKWDRSIPTAATNGVFMVWNPEFFKSLDRDSKVTVLAHEAWHIAFQHMSRVENRIFTIWNDAADYVINNMLKKGGYYMDGFPYLLDDKFNNWTTEQVYDYLIDNEIKVENPQDGDFFVPGEGPESMQGGMTPDQIAKKAFGNVHNASTASKMSKSHGDMPGEVKQMIDEFLKPKLPWQEIFINFFEALSSVEYSFSRPNRRYADPMLPSRVGRSGLELIHYYLDVSGSISNKEIQRFNSEVKYIKETYNPERLVLITFDTKLQDFYEFEEDDEFEEIVVTGRGGTNLSQVWAHAKEHQPNAMVVFTDLHVSIPTEEPGPPVIWVVSGNSRAEVPYGTLINIEED